VGAAITNMDHSEAPEGCDTLSSPVSAALCAACKEPCCKEPCCKAMAGAASPSDFGRTPFEVTAGLNRALESGDWAIDWWEGDARPGYTWDDADHRSVTYFIRPRHQGKPIVEPTWGGTCVFLGRDGCKLPFTSLNGSPRRPANCRNLIVKTTEGGSCTPDILAHKQASAVRWGSYQSLLGDLRSKYEDSCW
jgi:hypothetical protein